MLGNALLIAACLHPDQAGLTRPAVAARDAVTVRHDPLTGLAGRTVLIDRLERPGPVAVLRLDLDGFKEVTDTYGQEAGDLVLSTVARRLSAAVRASDLVARLDGDEFVLLCPGLPQAEAIRLAERILGDVARPIEFRGTALNIGANVGIAADTPDRDVLRRADTAMHEAKREGPRPLDGGSRLITDSTYYATVRTPLEAVPVPPAREGALMAATRADLLEVRHHDDRISRYEEVTYCAWAGGVTVYRDGAQIARHDDVLGAQALRRASAVH